VRNVSQRPTPNKLSYFALLTEAEQGDAIRRLAAGGMGDHTIASATGQAVAAVRAILGQRPGCAECDE
jgi:hypothetical protein